MNTGFHLIKKVIIIDSESKWNFQQADILLQDGKIMDISQNINPIDESTEIYDFSGKYISPGWVGYGISLNEPGYEFREKLDDISCLAAEFGFTDLIFWGNSNPVIDNFFIYKEIIEKKLPCKIHLIPALTNQMEGKSMIDYSDFKNLGTVCFSDAFRPIQNLNLIYRILDYFKSLELTFVQIPHVNDLLMGGMADETPFNTSLGLKLIPPIAETVQIASILQIAKYTQTKIHFSAVHLSESVELIKNYFTNQNQHLMTFDLSCPHLVYTDEDLHTFDTNYKIFPPLSSKTNQNNFIEYIKSGFLKMISLYHVSRTIEEKDVEFGYAKPGMFTIPTFFSVLYQKLCLDHSIELDKVIGLFTNEFRKLIGVPVQNIEIGNKINLTVFSIDEKWKFDEKILRNLCSNTPEIGKEFIGKAVKTFICN